MAFCLSQSAYPSDEAVTKLLPLWLGVVKRSSLVERPVTCLSALSKVLEKIIWDQITKYLETNGLLPPNQHGFNMSALSAIQQEWADNTAKKLKTGVLLSDLSAMPLIPSTPAYFAKNCEYIKRAL